MKVGEVWKYKNWLTHMVDEAIREFNPHVNITAASIRVVIINIRGDVVWFREFNTEESEYNIKRESFIQIFEKVYEE